MAHKVPKTLMKPLELNASQKHTIETMIEKACKKHKVKGATITITGKEKTLFSMHYGVIDQKETPNHEAAMMMIGSTTKLLTGIAILVLCDAKKLRLDDAIDTHVSDLNIPNESKGGTVTIEDLLMHAGGLASDDMDLITNQNKTLKDTVEALNKTVRRVPPKTMYSYSNLSYALLGLIIESVTNMPYEAALKKLVLDPLKLDMIIGKDASVSKNMQGRFSQSFDKKGKLAIERLSHAMTASGSCTYATGEANAKLIRFFLQEHPTSVLKKETFQAMKHRLQTAHVDDDEMTSGLAMRHGYHRFYTEACNPIIGHGGATMYHHSTFDIALNQGFGIGIMTNSKNGLKMLNSLSVELLVQCFKAQGINIIKKPPRLDEKPFENKASMARDFVMQGMVIRHQLKRDQLFVKIAILKAKCVMQSDGFYALKPRGIARLPLLRKGFLNTRFKQTQKRDETVLMVEQASAYQKMSIALGSPLQTKKVPDAWKKAVGSYRVNNTNEALKKATESVRLTIKKDILILTMKILGSPNKVLLEPLNDRTAITQGFGRNARETLQLVHLENKNTLHFQGIEMIKTKN